jgi:hypothetical protein
MTERKNPFRVVGGTEANEAAVSKSAKPRGTQAVVEVDDKPEDRETGYRDRATVKLDRGKPPGVGSQPRCGAID